MPFYSYRCDTCEADFDRMLPMSRYSEPQACETCGGVARKVVVPVNFNLPGDDWASKNGRVAKQMRDKRSRVAVKEGDLRRAGVGGRLVPNVGGERVDSWGEAKKLAASQGKDTSSYEAKVVQEQGAKK